jgi:hypothetical protein
MVWTFTWLSACMVIVTFFPFVGIVSRFVHSWLEHADQYEIAGFHNDGKRLPSCPAPISFWSGELSARGSIPATTHTIHHQ